MFKFESMLLSPPPPPPQIESDDTQVFHTQKGVRYLRFMPSQSEEEVVYTVLYMHSGPESIDDGLVHIIPAVMADTLQAAVYVPDIYDPQMHSELMAQLQRDCLDTRPLVVYGHGYGCVAATHMAAAHNTHALVLRSPPLSLRTLVRDTHPLTRLVPHMFDFLLVPDDCADIRGALQQCLEQHVPTLILRLSSDSVVPPAHVRRVVEFACAVARRPTIVTCRSMDGTHGFVRPHVLVEAIQQFLLF